VKRLSPLMTLVIGLLVGLSIGAVVTVAVGDEIKVNYDQVVGQAGETTITRGKLAEYCIARAAKDVVPVVQEQAVIDEALRVSGVTATDAEIDARIAELQKYADNEMARKQLEAYPRPVLRDKLRSIIMFEKALKLTVTPREAEVFYTSYPQLFFTPPVAKLIVIATDKEADARRAMQRLKDGEDPSKLSSILSTNKMVKDIKGILDYQPRQRVNNTALAEAIFDANDGKGLRPGQYTEPIPIPISMLDEDGRNTVAGTEYWIAYMADFKPAKSPRFEEVKDIALFLTRGEKLRTLMPQWVKEQRKQITVKWMTKLDDPASPLAVVPVPNR
jgi:hypothetical protein